ncbi:MAG: TetR/AcrR family transcriptional regulator [Gammaproteobacteria bacterium]
MATREQAKNQRRRAIMDAARSLMQSSGSAGFSMRALAERAGVSIATPYNLFGSKQAIMIAILEIEMQDYRGQLEQLRASPIDALFHAVTIATARYQGDPGFHRALLFSIYNDGGTEFRSMFSGSSHAIWCSLVEDAQAAGLLDATVEPNAFSMILEHLFFGCLLEWVYGKLNMDELELRVQYGFALTMLGVASPATAGRLRERIATTQDAIWSLWKRQSDPLGSAGSGTPVAGNPL